MSWRPAILRVLALCAILFTLGATARAQTSDPGADGHEILVMLRLSPDHFRPNASYGGQYGDQLTSLLRRRLAEQVARRHKLIFVGDGWPMPLLGVDCYVMRVPQSEPVTAAIDDVSKDAQVAWSQPMHVYQMPPT